MRYTQQDKSDKKYIVWSIQHCVTLLIVIRRTCSLWILEAHISLSKPFFTYSKSTADNFEKQGKILNIFQFEQFLHLPRCFQMSPAVNASESVYMCERVKSFFACCYINHMDFKILRFWIACNI